MFYITIGPAHPSAAGGVAALSESVTHARFVGTNPASDEVVLMKILQVSNSCAFTLLLTQHYDEYRLTGHSVVL